MYAPEPYSQFGDTLERVRVKCRRKFLATKGPERSRQDLRAGHLVPSVPSALLMTRALSLSSFSSTPCNDSPDILPGDMALNDAVSHSSTPTTSCAGAWLRQLLEEADPSIRRHCFKDYLRRQCPIRISAVGKINII